MMTRESGSWRPKSSHVVATVLAIGAALWIASGMVSGKPAMQAPKSALPESAPPESAPIAQKVLPLVRVRVSKARLRVREVVLFGRTEAINKADVAAETSGRLIRKSVEKGEAVNKGDAIYAIHIDDRRVKLREAKASVDFQKIAYNAAMKLSKKQFQSRVKLAEALANLEKAKASLAMIKLEIARTVIRAPISGIINELPLSVGDFVRSGDVVASIVDLDPVRITGQVSEKNISRIHPGAAALARLPGGREIAGVIKYVSKVGSPATRTFRVDIRVDNSDGLIPEGLTTELRLPAGQEKAHLVSPAILTLSAEGAVGIKAVGPEGYVQFHPVSIIADTLEGVWLGGLDDELVLITIGQEFVRTGQKVRTATGAEKVKDANAGAPPS